jgi:hypothetical protein
MEYAYDTAKMAVEKNIRNLFITNGYPIKDVLKVIARISMGARSFQTKNKLLLC